MKAKVGREIDCIKERISSISASLERYKKDTTGEGERLLGS